MTLSSISILVKMMHFLMLSSKSWLTVSVTMRKRICRNTCHTIQFLLYNSLKLHVQYTINWIWERILYLNYYETVWNLECFFFAVVVVGPAGPCFQNIFHIYTAHSLSFCHYVIQAQFSRLKMKVKSMCYYSHFHLASGSRSYTGHQVLAQ